MEAPPLLRAPLVAQMVKNPAAAQETWVHLRREDPLEKEMAAHSSILARRIPWTEEPEGLQSMGSQRVGHDWVTNTFSLTFFPHLLSQNLHPSFLPQHVYIEGCFRGSHFAVGILI